MTDPELLSIYRETTWSVEVPGGAVKVRPIDTAPPALRPSAIVTAYNPASQLRDRAANQHADELLLGEIRALGMEPWRTLAHGTSEDAAAWDEPGWCLPGDTRETAVALGQDFGQNSVLWIDIDGRVANVCTREGFCGARVGEAIG